MNLTTADTSSTPIAPFKPATLALALGIALGLSACSIPRDVPVNSVAGAAANATTSATTAMPQMERFANLQGRLDKLNAGGKFGNPSVADAAALTQGKYDWARAQCWVRNAYSERHERDAAGFADAALTEADKIIRSLEAAGSSATKAPISPISPISPIPTALINHSQQLRPDLWSRAESLKKSAGFACAAPTVGCLEVQLSRSGHELAETGWRHANSYLAIAEDMAQKAQAQAKDCAPPAPPPPPVAAPAPVPAPVAAPIAAPQPTIEKVTLNASALFKFDKRSQTDLLPQGKAEMDQLAERIKQVYASVERIDLTGHTDRLGSQAYNATLSADRAETVKTYLQGKGVTAPMTTRGVGPAEPVVQCQGSKPTAELTNCLQPNRRVEITIVGVKK